MQEKNKVTVVKNTKPIKNVRILLIRIEISSRMWKRFTMETFGNFWWAEKAQRDKLEKSKIIIVNYSLFSRWIITLKCHPIFIRKLGSVS